MEANSIKKVVAMGIGAAVYIVKICGNSNSNSKYYITGNLCLFSINGICLWSGSWTGDRVYRAYT